MKRILFAALVVWSACGGGATPTKRSDKGRAVLVVKCDVPRATLVIDDRLISEIAQLQGGVRIAAGPHRVELRHDRYQTRYLDLTLARGERRVVDVSLSEALP